VVPSPKFIYFDLDDTPVPEDELTPEDPAQINEDEEIIYDPDAGEAGELEDEEPRKYYVDDVEFKVINRRVMYYGDDGKLLTDSVKIFSRKHILSEYETLDDFLKHWKESKRSRPLLKNYEIRACCLKSWKTK
jgi:type I restriction enzyme R subunit